jgi:DNA-binding transcriptional LysR family regulator
MHRRHEGRNIPIELLRTAVAIAETGSYTKAARELGLSQPSISLHVKRLQKILVGEIFDVSSGSPRLTAYGEVVIESARRVLSINDQLLALANVNSNNKNQLVVGIPNGIAPPTLSDLFKKLSSGQGNEVVFRNLSTEHLLKGLEGGYIDIALLADPPRTPPVTVLEWWEPLYWVKGPEFQFDPAKSIPLVSWPGGLCDRFGIAALKRAGLRYGTAFVSSQTITRLAAVRGGVGIMAVPSRSITDEVVIAHDRGLPELPQLRCGIYLRSGLEKSRVEKIISVLESQWKARESFDITTPSQKRSKLVVVKPK